MSELSEKLVEIKKEKDNEKRLRNLRGVCNEEVILVEAIDIAKHESTMNLSGGTLITALTAIMLNFVPNFSKIFLLILYLCILLYIIKFEFKQWTDLYYDLIEIRTTAPWA